MSDRAVGVTDAPAATPVVVEYLVRERTVNALTVCEQFLIQERERVASSLQAYSIRLFALASADAATAWRWMLRNPVGSTVTLALRDLVVSPLQLTNALANVNAPIFTLERWTATGTAAGGTTVAPSRVNSAQTPVGVLYSAAPTGLTAAKVATAVSFFPTVNLTTTSTDNRAIAPTTQDYHLTDPGIELAPGEAFVFRQSEAGTATETVSRAIVCSLTVEEFTRP